MLYYDSKVENLIKTTVLIMIFDFDRCLFNLLYYEDNGMIIQQP